MQLSPTVATSNSSIPARRCLIRDALVVAPGGQRMVALDLEMGARPLQHRCQQDWRDQSPDRRRDARQVERTGVQHRKLVGIARREVLDALAQGAAGILALE